MALSQRAATFDAFLWMYTVSQSTVLDEYHIRSLHAAQLPSCMAAGKLHAYLIDKISENAPGEPFCCTID